ncbi:MAG: DUF922 domain-containing Zn-dependent protease [Patescibacteria group bacterium]|nr:DUF922 domain-containing Zn-dependent protease [Patescibacteria group bacterium]
MCRSSTTREGTIPEEKEPVKDKKESKPKRNKLWCFLGGGCCLLLLILIVLSGIFPFLSLFRSSADTKIPSPKFSSSATPINISPTATPKATKTTQNQSYPEPSSCEHLQLVDSIPTNISPSNPGLKQDIDTHYYQVYGYTPYEVRAQLNECGAKSGGEAYDAYTSYYISWVYNYKPVAGGCNIKDVTVGVKVDFFYPKWEDPGNAQAGLAENWQRYMTNLITHENGHKDIAVEGAQAILNALLSLPNSATCGEDVQSLVSSTGNNIFADYNAREKAYDDETNHGATQGATFP